MATLVERSQAVERATRDALKHVERAIRAQQEALGESWPNRRDYERVDEYDADVMLYELAARALQAAQAELYSASQPYRLETMARHRTVQP